MLSLKTVKNMINIHLKQIKLVIKKNYRHNIIIMLYLYKKVSYLKMFNFS